MTELTETARTTVTKGTPESTVMSAAPGKKPPENNPCTAGEDSGNAGEALGSARVVMEVPVDTPRHSTEEASGTTGEVLDVASQQPVAPTVRRISSQAALGLEAAVHAPENKYALNPMILVQLFAC